MFDRPHHPYTEALLASIPSLDPCPEPWVKADDSVMHGELPSPMNPPSGCPFRTRCPLAQERCAVEKPALRSFGEGHRAACHFPLWPAASADTGR
ncbi:oligopeptide/dipeptide ABC transporter ATP-binding protein [Leekyejoonella antrihumi]|uniref:oligopeptide/dipeptide ABC transporter ATP-binding protein n=1 Tax=Leekyejoonella antrihumi TaxID=1660198 RepID=UPI001FE6D6A8|nr:oligopeptide/dipeptide ABC transporter ATP-binding protein [Leekyejoonella antrihumi]